jgi:hypothetical protein
MPEHQAEERLSMIENAQMRRRSLLIGAGLAAAALAIPRAAIDQSTISDISRPARKRVFRFAHLTDIHKSTKA